jgi:hypothetical protein
VAAAAQQMRLFEAHEAFLYHDIERPGFVALLGRSAGGERRRQTVVPLARLPQALARCEGGQDQWLSVGEFYKPNRQAVNLWRMPAAFADLDTHNMPALATLSPDAQTEVLLQACEDRLIPPPSLVVFSGRGLQAKWLFVEPVVRRALVRWQAVQRELNARLRDFGADARALDASRVLRVVGSYSSRSPDVVRLVHAARLPTMGGQLMTSGVVGYDFEVLADTLLPLQRSNLDEIRRARAEEQAQDEAELAARQARRASLVPVSGGDVRGLRTFVPCELAWDRLEDLRTLVQLRGHEEGLPAGERDMFIFLGACFLAQALTVRSLEAEIRALAQEFAPTWSEAEQRSCVSSALSRAQAAHAGKTVEFKGREVDPRYRQRNATLVELLRISPDEALKLKTILPKDEAMRRDAERQCARRRAKGAQPRADYLDAVAMRRVEAKRLKGEGLSIRAIAARLSVSPATVNNDLKA